MATNLRQNEAMTASDHPTTFSIRIPAAQHERWAPEVATSMIGKETTIRDLDGQLHPATITAAIVTENGESLEITVEFLGSGPKELQGR
jgi:hypothetical protein